MGKDISKNLYSLKLDMLRNKLGKYEPKDESHPVREMEHKWNSIFKVKKRVLYTHSKINIGLSNG